MEGQEHRSWEEKGALWHEDGIHGEVEEERGMDEMCAGEGCQDVMHLAL